MRLVLLLSGLAVLAAYPLQEAAAQDLFLKKSGGSSPAGAVGDKKAPAPLFLDNSSRSTKSSTESAKPLFLDQPGNRSASGVVYRPESKTAKIFDLQKKDPKALGKAEKLDAALDKTRLANLTAVQEESARLQAETAQALARSQAEWEARQMAQAQEDARQPSSAGMETRPEKATAPAANRQRSTNETSNRLPVLPGEESDNGMPRPVFNTRH